MNVARQFIAWDRFLAASRLSPTHRAGTGRIFTFPGSKLPGYDPLVPLRQNPMVTDQRDQLNPLLSCLN